MSATTPEGFSHHTAIVGDVRVHYVMGGQGDPVILVHGFPSTWYEWRHVMPALAERYKVIAPDLRGLGDSSRPYGGYDKVTLGEDLHGLVEHLGLGPILLVGHDWGGSAAFAYTRAHPANVRRLAILEHALPGFGLEELLVATPERTLWHMTFHTSDVAEALVAGRERMYLSWFYTHIAYNPAAISTEEIDEYVRTYSAPGAMRSGFNLYRTFWEDVEYNRAHGETKLDVPILTIGGEHCLNDLSERGFRQLGNDVHGVVIPDCGHWIPQERPHQLLAQLQSFFEDHDGERRDRVPAEAGHAA